MDYYLFFRTYIIKKNEFQGKLGVCQGKVKTSGS